jgi:hypothetical protein
MPLGPLRRSDLSREGDSPSQPTGTSSESPLRQLSLERLRRLIRIRHTHGLRWSRLDISTCGKEQSGGHDLMSHQAFMDESNRGASYLICAATVAAVDLSVARRAILNLRIPGQRRIHFAAENHKRRRQLLTQLASVNAASFIYVANHRVQVEARSAIMRKAAPHLHGRGVRRLVVESRQGQDHRDRADLYAALGDGARPPLTYTHLMATAEPLLWLPDAIAWAWGRGGVWRDQVTDLGLVREVHCVEVP